MASVSSVVITGRSMHSVGRVMASSLPLGDRSGLRLRGAGRRLHGDAGAVGEAELAVDHHALAGLEPARDHGLVVERAVEPYEPQFDSGILLDHEKIGTILPDLD